MEVTLSGSVISLSAQPEKALIPKVSKLSGRKIAVMPQPAKAL